MSLLWIVREHGGTAPGRAANNTSAQFPRSVSGKRHDEGVNGEIAKRMHVNASSVTKGKAVKKHAPARDGVCLWRDMGHVVLPQNTSPRLADARLAHVGNTGAGNHQGSVGKVMAKFAAGTTVAPDKSRLEIESILARYGASHFAYMNSPDRVVIAFRANNRNIRFDLVLPTRDAAVTTPTGRPRSDKLIDAAWQQEIRQRWRALALCIKAKLESVESSIETFESAFMAHIVMPDGRTVGEHVLPAIAESYSSGRHVPLLPGPPN
jgi:hypothetical protein